MQRVAGIAGGAFFVVYLDSKNNTKPAELWKNTFKELITR